MKPGIQYILGKTIAGIVTAANGDSPPRHLILVFTDGTQLKLHGESFACSLDQGGVPEAIRSVRRTGGDVKVLVHESAGDALEATFARRTH